jgi:dUTP pyrophosphatase
MGYAWSSGSDGWNNGHRHVGIVPFFKIEGRSGLASKGIFPVGGIIDPSYRGEICVLLFNSTESSCSFNSGDRVAQLVCYHSLAPLEGSQVTFEIVDDVVSTDRGDKGFGSSGVI